MPWVRIDENAIDHPKFLALSDGAWRLWVEGLAYCQKHLTDGEIPIAALRGFRHFSVSKMRALTTPYRPGSNPLWVRTDDHTITVHDYLKWNESREKVLQDRQQAQERRQRYRDRKSSVDASEDASQTATETENVVRGVSLSGSSGSSNHPEETPRTRDLPSNGKTLPERAGALCDFYSQAHEKYRDVPYIGNARKDYEEALQLVAKFGDEQLQKAAVVFLNADDDFARSRTATIAMFRSRVPWCLERLKARGIA